MTEYKYSEIKHGDTVKVEFEATVSNVWATGKTSETRFYVDVKVEGYSSTLSIDDIPAKYVTRVQPEYENKAVYLDPETQAVFIYSAEGYSSSGASVMTCIRGTGPYWPMTQYAMNNTPDRLEKIA